MKRLLSSILVAAMLIGMLSMLPFLSLAAEEDDPLIEIAYVNYQEIADAVLNQAYGSAQEKIDGDENMRLFVTYGKYALYANTYTGEVYVKDSETGEILTSNPYDSTGKSMAASAPAEFMSQIILQYRDPNNSMSKTTTMTSFTEAARRGQISIDSIKDGIRVNYILGDMTKRYLLPASIPALQFAEIFLAPAQRQVAADIREAVEAALAEDPTLETDRATLERNLDYEAFSASAENYSKWNVAELFGEDITWGNEFMFKQWHDNLTKKHQKLAKCIDRVWEKSDYYILTYPYRLCSAYIVSEGTGINSAYGGATRADWTLNYDALGMDDEGNLLDKDKWDPNTDTDIVEYLRADSYQKEITDEYGDVSTVTCYPNSCYILEEGLLPSRKQSYERIFLDYATEFTEEDMYEAENKVGHTEAAANNALFCLALEYTLDENGLSVTMPARSIVFDETKYAVDYINVLPYLGSGKVQEGGFIFYPDGSGAVIDFDDYQTKSSGLSGKVYGQDYAFYSISGKHQQAISLPVFGSVRNQCTYYMIDPFDTTGNTKIPVSEALYRTGSYTFRYVYDETARQIYRELPDGTRKVATTYFTLVGDVPTLRSFSLLPDYATSKTKCAEIATEEAAKCPVTTFEVEQKQTSGYLAILEEGASLATINVRVNDAGNYSKPYTSIYAQFTPRESDRYNLADVMSGAESSAFSILAEGKYTGDYTIRYVMLTDSTVAAERGVTAYYPTTYAGMATAYRDYLYRNGVLTALENLEEDLPLYIESFGVIQTTEKHLSIPFTVDVALTSFDDVGRMYDELKSQGITNVKFRLTGFANGGLLTPTYPVTLNWESEAGGKRDFKALLTKLSGEDTGVEIFPNFDFFYTTSDKNIKLKEYGARSVDNRYAWRQSYGAVFQTYMADGGIVISTDRLLDSFEKFERKYGKYDISSISLEAAASGLSSNFDKENFIDRETALDNVCDFLKTVRNSGYTSVMGTGGNVYALRYLDHLIEAPLESSSFNATSYAVPFWGMVMHGALQYAGTAYNEQANRSEAFLRAIESGASLYYLLSYDHTQLLKDTGKSDYYSVSYEISKDAMMTEYNRLNDLIGDLQNYIIVDHCGVYAERVKLASESAAQLQQLQTEFAEQLRETVTAYVEDEKALLRYVTEQDIDCSQPYADLYNAGLNSAVDTLINTFTADGNRVFAALVTEDMKSKGDIWDAIRGTLQKGYGKTIGVCFDRDAVLASAAKMTYTDTSDAAFVAELTAYMDATENASADIVLTIGEIAYTSAYRYLTVSDALADDYVTTESTVANHTVVLVTYSNGTDTVRFLLNFNIFEVTVRIDGRVIKLDRYGYEKLD